MKKIYITILVVLIGLIVCEQAKGTPTPIIKYEYWFDNDVGGRTLVTVNPTFLLEVPNIPVQNLSPGMHICHFRAQDELGLWSVPKNILFFNEAQNITAYKYWFDDNDSTAQTYNIAPNNIVTINNLDLAECPNGIHTLTIQVIDNNGNWSCPKSSLFFKAGINVSEMQYWFDGDIENAVSLPQTGQIITIDNLSVSSLSPGFHVATVRFKDNMGLWSVHKNISFFNVGGQFSKIEYWFDSDYSTLVEETVSISNNFLLIENIDLSGITSGYHRMSLRAQDNSGNWSSPITCNFFNTGSLITAYEYWLDGDIDNRVSAALPEPANLFTLDMLDLSYLQKGDYLLTIRFKDIRDNWSAPLSQNITKSSFPIASFTYEFIQICDSATVVLNGQNIDGDTFLWDFGDGTYDNTTLTPTHNYYEPGTYQISFTVTDTALNLDSTVSMTFDVHTSSHSSMEVAACGSYTAPDGAVYDESGIVTAIIPNSYNCDSIITIDLTVNPVYLFEETAELCDGETLNWHDQTLTESGVYSVQLQTVHGCDSIYQLTLTVNELPEVAIEGETEINLGESTTLTATGAVSYVWSTGETTASITVSPTDTTTYSVIGTNEAGCSGEESITVNVITVGILECDASAYKVYPNPATCYATVEGENISQLELYNSVGQLIMQQKIDERSASIRVNINRFENGMYVLRIITKDKNVVIKRLIIAR